MVNILRGIGKSEHERIEEMLSAYIDGELSTAQKARVDAHLAKCEDCARNLRTMRQTVSLLGQLPTVKAPRSFAIREAQVTPRRRAGVRWSWAYSALQGATVLAFLLFVVVSAGDVTLTHFAPAMGGAPMLAYSAPAEEAPAAQWITPNKRAGQVEETVVVEEVVTATPAEMPVPPAPTGTPVPAVMGKAAPTPTPAAPAAYETDEGTQDAGLPTEEAMMVMVEQTPAATPTQAAEEATPAPTEEAMVAMAERSAATPPPPAEAAPLPTETPVEVVSRQGPEGGVPEEEHALRVSPFANPARVALWVIEGGLLVLAVALLAATLWVRRARRQL